MGSRPRRVSTFLLLAVPALLVAGTVVLVVLSRRPVPVGLVDGKLAPCPPSPNCVCSEGGDRAHAIEPFAFEGDPDAAFAEIRALVEALPGAHVVRAEGDWLHAVCLTRWLRFADDLELRLDRANGVIQVRSAARVGTTDFGANRARVEDLRERWRSRRAGSAGDATGR